MEADANDPFGEGQKNTVLAKKQAKTVTKVRVEQVLKKCISFRIAQKKMCKEVGFDLSKETFIKGETSVAIILEVTFEYVLVIMLEMNALKVEFFDCDTFVTTIDDLIVSLIEVLDEADTV